MKCNELNAAIAELKQKLEDAKADAAETLEHLRPMEASLEMAEADVKAYKQRIAVLEKEIAELKKKLEDVQASMYADVVDANMENRRLRRALWRAIALFCARSCEYFNGIMSHCLMGQDDLYKRCKEKKYKYLHTMYKCRAKAEEYK